jgi:hypothetical protein
MDGYLTEYELSDDYQTILLVCRRFADLYGYVRVLLRALSEKWANEPVWLFNLKGKLSKALKHKSSCFGKKL